MPQAWPSTTVPGPQGKYGMKFTSGLSENDSDRQVEMVRRTGDLSANVTWLLSPIEWAAFKAFYDTTLNGGCDWFSADWLVEIDADALFACFGDEGYSADLDEAIWTVSATLEIIR